MQESLTSKLRKLVSPGAGRLIPGAANALEIPILVDGDTGFGNARWS